MSEEEIGVDIVIENEEGSVEAKSDVLKGDKGDKGDPTATIEINKVITGEAGTETKIENVGTDVKLKLNITIPRGDKGEQGIKGDTPQKGTDYFTEEEIQEIKSNILDQVNQFSVLVVEELPTENIDDHTIYFIPKATAEQNDVYDEYIYINNDWEHIGTTEVDLSSYYNKEEIDKKLSEVAGLEDNVKDLQTKYDSFIKPINLMFGGSNQLTKTFNLTTRGSAFISVMPNGRSNGAAYILYFNDKNTLTKVNTLIGDSSILNFSISNGILTITSSAQWTQGFIIFNN